MTARHHPLVQAWAPVDRLPALADHPNVSFVRPPREPVAYFTVEGGVSDAAVESATLSFTVDSSALPADADPDDVAVLRYHDGEWQVLDTTRYGDTYTAETPGFSAFAVVVTEADLVVTDAALDADSVAVGEAATATVTVENQGTREGTRTVELRVDDSVVATTEVTVAAGETEQVTLSWTPEEAGTYEVTAGDESAGSLSVTDQGATTTTTTTTSDGDGPTGPDDGDGGFGSTFVGLLAALVVIAALGVAYAWRKGLIGGDGDAGGDE